MDKISGDKEKVSCRQRTNRCESNLEPVEKCNPNTLGLNDFVEKLKASSCGKIIESNIKECIPSYLNNEDGSDSKNLVDTCCAYWKMTRCFNDESKTKCKNEKQKKEFDDIVNNWKECQTNRSCSQFSDGSEQCNNSPTNYNIYIIIIALIIVVFFTIICLFVCYKMRKRNQNLMNRRAKNRIKRISEGDYQNSNYDDIELSENDNQYYSTAYEYVDSVQQNNYTDILR